MSRGQRITVTIIFTFAVFGMLVACYMLWAFVAMAWGGFEP